MRPLRRLPVMTKRTCSEWKKRNKAQRSGQMDLLVAGTQPWDRLGNLAEALRQLGGARG